MNHVKNAFCIGLLLSSLGLLTGCGGEKKQLSATIEDRGSADREAKGQARFSERRQEVLNDFNQRATNSNLSIPSLSGSSSISGTSAIPGLSGAGDDSGFSSGLMILIGTLGFQLLSQNLSLVSAESPTQSIGTKPATPVCSPTPTNRSAPQDKPSDSVTNQGDSVGADSAELKPKSEADASKKEKVEDSCLPGTPSDAIIRRDLKSFLQKAEAYLNKRGESK